MHADIEGANRARIYQGLLGWPETSTFNKYVNNNLLINCSITVDDLSRAKHINGEATPIMQGKFWRKKQRVHSKIEKIPLPIPISERHKNLHLYMDIFM